MKYIVFLAALFILFPALRVAYAALPETNTVYSKSLEPAKTDVILDINGLKVHRIVDYQQDNVCYLSVWGAKMNLSCVSGTR